MADMNCNRPYQRLESRIPWDASFAFIDTKEYLADQLFANHGIAVRFGDEYAREGTPYRIVFCKVRRWAAKAFVEAISELPNKMLLCGHPDYVSFCETAWKKLMATAPDGEEDTK